MFLLFDIGGTKVRIATSSDKQTIENVKVLETDQDFDQVLVSFKKAVAEFGEKFEAASGGTPGIFNKDKSEILHARNLPNWTNKPLKMRLSEILNAPVFLENDASLAGLGEAIFGAGKDKKIVAYLTISTGVGGARIVNGEIDAKSTGFEPGKQIVDITGDPPIVLEDFISGRAIEKKYGKKGEEIEDEVIWDEVARNLAVGINNVLVFWSPDIVILGGSVMESINLDKVREYAQKINKISPQIPPIEKASLGDKAGLWGALAYLKQKLN